MTDNKTKIMGNLKVPLFIHILLTANSILKRLIYQFFCIVATSSVKICVMTWTVLPRAVGRSGIGREAQYYVLRLRKWFYNPIKSWLKIMPFMSHGHSHGLRSEVSLIEQDTIECVILAYHIWFAAKNYAFLTFTLCNFLLQTLTNFFLPMKFFLEVA